MAVRPFKSSRVLLYGSGCRQYPWNRTWRVPDRVLAARRQLAWRLVMRMIFTGRNYGVDEAFWALPRFLVGNLVSLIAAPRAVFVYIGMLPGTAPATTNAH
ncbi:MAG: hypothetical protein EOO77_30885 [Oxalobacteraceae bacterium]|nr:MAG: hypothetical protein EOO77_30885 [Oxalobacteraceae bacterium]